jgi:hypothetical protein
MRSRCCVCVSVYSLIVARQRLGKNPPIVARQRLGRNITAVTITHATMEELFDASFSMWPVSHQNLFLSTVCYFSLPPPPPPICASLNLNVFLFPYSIITGSRALKMATERTFPPG